MRELELRGYTERKEVLALEIWRTRKEVFYEMTFKWRQPCDYPGALQMQRPAGENNPIACEKQSGLAEAQ